MRRNPRSEGNVATNTNFDVRDGIVARWNCWDRARKVCFNCAGGDVSCGVGCDVGIDVGIDVGCDVGRVVGCDAVCYVGVAAGFCGAVEIKESSPFAPSAI